MCRNPHFLDTISLTHRVTPYGVFHVVNLRSGLQETPYANSCDYQSISILSNQDQEEGLVKTQISASNRDSVMATVFKYKGVGVSGPSRPICRQPSQWMLAHDLHKLSFSLFITPPPCEPTACLAPCTVLMSSPHTQVSLFSSSS
jgi:hypothetical protein